MPILLDYTEIHFTAAGQRVFNAIEIVP